MDYEEAPVIEASSVVSLPFGCLLKQRNLRPIKIRILVYGMDGYSE